LRRARQQRGCVPIARQGYTACMSIDRVNFFTPYERAPAWHENQLTRALLVVLRYSPMAHVAWLQLIAPEQRLSELASAEFATQRRRVLTSDPDLHDGEAMPGISVWLAPDATEVAAQIKPSDRQQVLDGIVTYGTDLVVVIENKIGWGGATEQPSQINLHGSAVRFSGTPRSVTWQELLAMLSDLVERDLVHGAEGMIIGDFFDLVEAYFPRIGPYSTLSRCSAQKFRVERRLDAIMGLVARTDSGKGMGWRDLSGTNKIAMAHLGYSSTDSEVRLSMYPADTLGQSRSLYNDPAAVEEVLALQSNGWTVEPNFHWGFTASGYAWMTSPLEVEAYCAYWVRNIGATGEVKRPKWDSYWQTLVDDQIVTPGAKEEFDKKFTRSNRQKCNPRPGVGCTFRWTLEEAEQLDSRGEFMSDVRSRVNDMLSALHAPPLDTTMAASELPVSTA